MEAPELEEAIDKFLVAQPPGEFSQASKYLFRFFYQLFPDEANRADKEEAAAKQSRVNLSVAPADREAAA